MKPSEHKSEIWTQLVAGRPLDGLGLALKGGRFDVSGLVAKAPSVGARLDVPYAEVNVLDSLTVMRGVTWRGLDFSGSDLRQLRLIDCRIEDCVFDSSNCQGWRMWKTLIHSCTFRGTDFRHAALGGLLENHRNTFRDVAFVKTDLRETAIPAAEFIGCRFENSRLRRLDFGTSSFVDCSFRGELNEVVFNRVGWMGESLPPNEMLRVDMSQTQLRMVEFRGLSLESVALPVDEDHIVLDDFPEILDQIIEMLRARNDLTSRGLAEYFGVFRKWAGRRGVINKRDIALLSGQQALADVMTVIERSRG